MTTVLRVVICCLLLSPLLVSACTSTEPDPSKDSTSAETTTAAAPDPESADRVSEARRGQLRAPATYPNLRVTEPAPGSWVSVGQTPCTLGPIIDDVAYIARHCSAGNTRAEVTNREGALLGHVVAEDGGLVPRILGNYADVVPVTLEDGASVDTRIGGVYPTSREVTPPSALTYNSVVCLWGAVSGESCGTVADGLKPETAELVSGAGALHGDSGAPVYTVDSNTGIAHVVAVQSEQVGIDGGSRAVWLEPLIHFRN